MASHLSRDDRVRIQTLAEFYSVKQLAEKFQRPKSTIYNVLNKPLTPTKGRGRKKIYDTPERKRLAAFVTENAKNWDFSTKDLALIQPGCQNTIKKALHKEGLYR